MKKSLPLFIILAVVVIFFRQFFLDGLLPIPSDALVGLYNPFRDVYATSNPRGVPFKNFLITDPIRQIYPWKNLVIDLEKQFKLPLWNPYSFSGYPLLANFQSGVFYPLNILYLIFPFYLGWSISIFLSPLLAGIFLYLYLKNLKLHPTSCLLGAFAFSFSGFAVSWLEWNTVFQTILWLPLILLAKDKLLKKWTFDWAAIFFLAEASSFFAGHLQIWFYSVMVTNVYLFFKILLKVNKENKSSYILKFIKTYKPFLLIGIGVVIITSVQWVPTLQFIFLSSRSIDQNYLTTAGWFVPWQHLIQFVAPDFFGNPATLNYWGVWNYAELVGYIGIFPLLMAFFAAFFRHDKKTYFWVGISLVSLILALPTPLAKLPFSLRIPLLSTSQPTRLMGIIDFSLAILAALGFDLIIKSKSKKISTSLIVGFFVVIFTLLWLFVLRLHPESITVENLLTAKRNLIFPTAIFVSIGLILLVLAYCEKYIPRKAVIVILSSLLLVTLVDQLRFAEKFTPFTPQDYLYPQASSLSFLQKNAGEYRIMTTDSRILAPDISDMYHLQSIEGYDPLYLQNYGAFIAAMQRSKADITKPYGFNRIITPHIYQSPLINLLGVKYILSFNNISSSQFTKVFQEGQTIVYKNNNVLPRTFFVNNVLSVKTKQSAIDAIFANEKNLKTFAVVQGNISIKPSMGNVAIKLYSPNEIDLTTQNRSEGFMVLTDIYYPTWHAYIDGKETKIYETDFAFRGIVVPVGNHTIVFEDQLL